MSKLMIWLCAMPEYMSWFVIIGIGFIIFMFGFYFGIIWEMDSFKKGK